MKKILYFTLILLSLSACNHLFVDENPVNTPTENFNILWKAFDEHYCFFREKQVDWVAMKEKYGAQVDDRMSGEDFFAVCARMTGELKDGHVNIKAPFNISYYWDWYLDYPQNFNFSVIERNYLGRDHITTSGMQANIIRHNGEEYGYMYYNSFMSKIDETGMLYLEIKFADCKGVIIDIRNNSGGEVATMFKLASYFTTTERQIGYSRYKKGKGHDDFTEWYPEKIKTSNADAPSGIRNFGSKDVVLLTNRASYSAANIFTGILKQLPNVTVMGDCTGGGSGSPMSINMPNGWVARFSSIVFADNDKQHFEFGVAPHIEKSTNEVDAAAGKDAIIDAAIEYLEGL